MEEEPDGDGEDSDSGEAVPGPGEVMGLHGVNGDHEIIGEAGVAEEGAVFGIAPPDAAVQGHGTKDNHQTGDGEVDGEHGVPFDARVCATCAKIRVNPLRCRP